MDKYTVVGYRVPTGYVDDNELVIMFENVFFTTLADVIDQVAHTMWVDKVEVTLEKEERHEQGKQSNVERNG